MCSTVYNFTKSLTVNLRRELLERGHLVQGLDALRVRVVADVEGAGDRRGP